MDTGFSGGSDCRNLPAMQEIWVQSLGWEDPLEKGMATDSSILAWRVPWTEEPGGLLFMWSQRVGHDWVTNRHTHPETWVRFSCPCFGQKAADWESRLSECRVQGHLGLPSSSQVAWWLKTKQNKKPAGLIPGLGKSLAGGNGNPLQYCCLENPMDTRVWRAAVHGVAKIWTHLSNCACTHSQGHLGRSLHPKFPWRTSLAGCLES